MKKMSVKINGIQQLGVGVNDLGTAWKWYRRHFAMDIRMFEEEAVAELMLPHTGGKARARHAVLALNMRGGGGFEIWQHKGKTPEPPKFELQLGDLGINIGKLKSDNVSKAYQKFKSEGLDVIGKVEKDPAGHEHFFLKDYLGNLWEVVNHKEVFRREKSVTGGVLGAIIGVGDMEESLKIYRNILQYDKKVYDLTDTFPDLASLPGGNGEFRRILLEHSGIRNGAFSPFFGSTCIELVQALDRQPRDIYEDRMWGDPGFIHLCFDINGMEAVREKVGQIGYPFTVDSSRDLETFDMGKTAGNFAYIKAPEGTLIEFVETHKIPILEKIGWTIDFRKRGNHPLPDWLLKMFRFKRVKK
jgi:catechol 2,3-dioxygenase-like lactoylglutathione lyase family enzyme/uncharacterized glyoxalase superfamily protein PhnB